MYGKIKSIKWPEPSEEWINFRKYIEEYKQQFIGLYQQEFPVSNFYSRIKNIINPAEGTREYHELTVEYRRFKGDATVRVRHKDLVGLFNVYEDMDNRLREIYIDADLRSDPERVNIPNGFEKELNIKRVINFRSKLK